MLPDSVRIVEVGARDGLQNLPTPVSPEIRAQLVDLLSQSGLRHIETGSFVSPKSVPQMAESDQVFQTIYRQDNVVYAALTPNLRGMEDALKAGANEAAVFASASEGFSQKNINCSIAESLKRFEPVMELAKQHNIPVRGYVSCIISCPYDGETTPQQVAEVTKALYQMGCYEVSLGDTVGTGTPLRVKKVLEACNRNVPMEHLAAHYHNTYGQALANIYASLEEGLAVVDSAVAGLGGCPYAPGASGNVATEDVLYLMEGLNIKTGIQMDKLLKAATFICKQLGIRSRSSTGLALKPHSSG
ncbi:hydroxymethylglutaryl-CoA lyase [Endozoicomonas numazuensis]|uniref:hydroxymethylglutaryl-CoA lyase n=1 Tax=Endozoicomonas numazuensis TaxID=1137799 RepID=A0A081NMD7_9GAMM|nr:hydroxymethylglutaryl-CoA lyase [Endozoicomonas numazuensis]KEQ19610.1 hydroxymethylglutaryl-CoA lyase [Endozoicomonas numazuensis]